MANARKMTPARFLKRNRPYFILALVLIVLAASIFLILRRISSFSPAAPVETPSGVSKPSQPEAPSEPSGGTQVPDAEQPAPEENLYVPPFDGTRVLLASNQLIATYDAAALQLTDGGTLASLTPLAENQTARIDVQPLNTSMKLLKKAELARICTGAMQAYYFAAPPTEDISVTVLNDEDGFYAAELQAPEYGGASAVTAQVRLYELSGTLWCVSAVYPDGEDCTALRQTFDSITVRTADMEIKGVQLP